MKYLVGATVSIALVFAFTAIGLGVALANNDDHIFAALQDYFNGEINQDLLDSVVDNHFNQELGGGGGGPRNNDPPPEDIIIPPPSIEVIPPATPKAPPQTAAQQSSTPTPIKLVSNTGQSGNATEPWNFDLAQAFTTGNNRRGYTLTSLDFHMSGVGAFTPGYEIHIYNADASGNPGSSIGKLNKPSTLTTSGANSATASGAGIDLKKETKYFVLIDMSSKNGPNFGSLQTTSDSEDSGAAAGWSIGDVSHWRTRDSITPWFTEDENLVIAIKGYAKSAPAGLWISPSVQRVDVSGRTVTVTMDKPVALASGADLKAAFTVYVYGTGYEPTGASIVDNGRKVQLTMPPGFSAPGCAKLSVEYGLRFGSRPLLDAADTFRDVNSFGHYGTGKCISPALVRAQASGTTVTVTMDKAVALAANANLKAAFTVYVYGTGYEPTGASIVDNGRKVQLTMPGGFSAPGCAKLSVEYGLRTGSRPLLDAATRMEVDSFGHHGTGTCVFPRPSRADISGKTVTLTMDKAVKLRSGSSGTGAAFYFGVFINRVKYDPASVSVSGRQVTLTLEQDATLPNEITKLSVTYSPGGGAANRPLLDAATGLPLSDFGIYG